MDTCFADQMPASEVNFKLYIYLLFRHYNVLSLAAESSREHVQAEWNSPSVL